MTTQQNAPENQAGDAARPDFLQMDGSQSSDAGDNTDSWYGWPHKKVEPVTLLRPDGKTERVRTPVMDLEGLITPPSCTMSSSISGCPKPWPFATGPSPSTARSKSPCA